MEAKEVRIGNLYTHETSTGNFFYKITINDICFLLNDPLDGFYKPIQLTEEWLIKFGCFKKPGVVYLNLDAIQPDSDYGYGFEWEDKKLFLCDCYSGVIGKQIIFVHQLQNIYFALTGKELIYEN